MSPHLLNPSMLTWAAIAAACAIGTLLALITLRRLRLQSAIRNPQSAILDDSGTTTIEFAMVLPILGFMVMAMTQTTFLMAGNLFVNYAAFAATRSAIVQIPAAYPDDPANQFTASQGMTKYDAIQHTAAFALVPVAGRSTSASTSGGGASVSTTDYVNGLAAFYTAYSVNQPRWIDSLAADRLRYALDNTLITVMSTQVNNNTVTYTPVATGSSQKFEPRAAVTVRVEHKLNLSVPYINRIFASGANASGVGKFRYMSAQSTLSNEGITDTLPPKPTLPRIAPLQP